MTDLSHDTTLHLLQAAQAGDPRATDRLFGRLRDRLLQVVSLLLAKRRRGLLEDEEDIVQDTLLKALQGLGSFTPRSEGSLLHWLSRLALNNLRDALRREGAAKRGGGRVRPRADHSGDFLISSLFPGREPTPSQAARGTELVEQVETLVIALPERERRAFVMRNLCGLAYEEVAQELGLGSAASARALHSRAMAHLSARLPEDFGR